MKKVLAIFSIVALASCGGGETKETVVDSVKVDSVLESKVDLKVDTVFVEGEKQGTPEVK